MTNTQNNTVAAVVALTGAALLADFMAKTYPNFAGDKWSQDLGGPLPSYDCHQNAALFGARLGSKQALALSLTLRDCGSTAAQRTYAGQGKTQNNVGGLQDLLRSQHKTAKLVAGQTYKLTLSNGAVFDVVSNKAGHVQAKLVTPPTVAAAPKVAAKVQAKADAKADKPKALDKPKGK